MKVPFPSVVTNVSLEAWSLAKNVFLMNMIIRSVSLMGEAWLASST